MATTAINPLLQNANNQLEADVKSIGSLLETIDSLKSQLSLVTTDDTSLAAKLLAANKQLSRVQQLAKYSAQMNVHKSAFTLDPNARPIMQWFQPGNSGNSGGASAVTHGTWAIEAAPDGSIEFGCTPARQFDDFIFGLNYFTVAASLHHGLQVTEFEITDDQMPNAMAVETNWEHSMGGFRNNHGIQALLGTDKDAVTGKPVTNRWRYFDIGAGHWFDTGIPFDRTMFGTGKRIELIAEILQSDDPAQGTQNVSLTINGTTYAVNKWTKARASTWGPYFQRGWQLDPLTLQPFKVKVWNMEEYWF